MKRMKKYLALVMTAVLMSGILQVPVFAADETEEPVISVTEETGMDSENTGVEETEGVSYAVVEAETEVTETKAAADAEAETEETDIAVDVTDPDDIRNPEEDPAEAAAEEYVKEETDTAAAEADSAPETVENDGNEYRSAEGRDDVCGRGFYGKRRLLPF